MASLDGTGGNDWLYGTDEADQINGLGGIDNLYGYAGDDTMDGGTGRDYLHGWGGDDDYVYNVNGGRDYIYEDGGFDQLLLGPGISPSAVTLLANGSHLYVRVGNSASNQIEFNSFYNDAYRVEEIRFHDGTVWDLTGALTLTGTNGNDYLYGRGFNDTINARGGDDQLYGDAGNDALNGDDGNDGLFGNAGNDVVRGGTGDDWLFGEDGSDYLAGGLGNDAIYGGNNADNLVGDGGNDELYGGAFSDTYIFNLNWGRDYIQDESGANDIIRFGTGITPGDIELHGYTDDLWITHKPTGNTIQVEYQLHDTYWGTDQTREIETIRFADGTVWDISQGLDLGTDDELGETIYGTKYVDTLRGGDGDDQLYGYAGDDALIGGGGDDHLDGGLGFDTARYDTGTAITGAIVNLTAGNQSFDGQTVGGSYARDQHDDTDYLVSVENAVGSSLADAFFGSGAANTFAGGGGDDRLYGFGGKDQLTGDAGADTFFYTAPNQSGAGSAARDVIADFSGAGGQGDVLHLSNIDANANLAGNQGFTPIGASAFSGAAGQLRAYASGGNTIVEGDVNGDAFPDFQIQVNGIVTFTANVDLIL